jgi:hypothetical protein
MQDPLADTYPAQQLNLTSGIYLRRGIKEYLFLFAFPKVPGV